MFHTGARVFDQDLVGVGSDPGIAAEPRLETDDAFFIGDPKPVAEQLRGGIALGAVAVPVRFSDARAAVGRTQAVAAGFVAFDDVTLG